VRSGADNEVITVLEVPTPSGYRLVNMRVYRGETTIFAALSNGIPRVTATPGEAVTLEARQPSRPSLQITIDELIRLATAPELTLTP
jgi:hypothetical protein